MMVCGLQMRPATYLYMTVCTVLSSDETEILHDKSLVAVYACSTIYLHAVRHVHEWA